MAIECVASRAHDVARRFLYRWRDARTTRLAEDLAQQATFVALRRMDTLHDPTRLAALVRTIVRRLRYRALMREQGREVLACDIDAEFPEPTPRRPDSGAVHVRGRWIERDRILPLLECALARLPPLNERLLREYYGGESCRALAVRHRQTLDTVKVRLHRSRRRVRELLEHQVSALRA
jgi:DNA-directed RNA polymerase specialized sigma24 family protein